MFYILLLYVHSRLAIILMGKRERERELSALLSLSSWCLVISLSAMSLSAVCDCDTHVLFLRVIHANSVGFGESAHLLGLV